MDMCGHNIIVSKAYILKCPSPVAGQYCPYASHVQVQIQSQALKVKQNKTEYAQTQAFARSC